MRALLSTIVVLLALAVGVLHLALIWVLFRGNVFGPFGGPPPGAPGLPFWPGVLPLPQLFLLNMVLYLVLVLAFLLALRSGRTATVVVDVLFVLATLATLAGWNNIRRPNPQGLGTWAVTLEIALIVFALFHALTTQRRRI